jgi:hypothetical protein
MNILSGAAVHELQLSMGMDFLERSQHYAIPKSFRESMPENSCPCSTLIISSDRSAELWTASRYLLMTYFFPATLEFASDLGSYSHKRKLA